MFFIILKLFSYKQELLYWEEHSLVTKTKSIVGKLFPVRT